MYKSAFVDKSNLPLQVCGYEINTAQDVFVLTRALDAALSHSLEADGFVWRTNIALSDGQVVDGWVKV